MRAHARSASHRCLRLPFPSAVKTGTSSDFRDTWTVGFTRDYTVATWVGNFDGAPMQRITGVTGAAPLWNRIMLHLAEAREPGTFAPPRGYARRAICATTGALPGSSVRERRLGVARRARIGSRCRRHRSESPSPASHRRATAHATLPGGTILMRADAAFGDRVRWTVDGRRAGEGARVPLALRRGTFTIGAQSERGTAVAHVVVAGDDRGNQRSGFTVTR